MGEILSTLTKYRLGLCMGRGDNSIPVAPLDQVSWPFQMSPHTRSTGHQEGKHISHQVPSLSPFTLYPQSKGPADLRNNGASETCPLWVLHPPFSWQACIGRSGKSQASFKDDILLPPFSSRGWEREEGEKKNQDRKWITFVFLVFMKNSCSSPFPTSLHYLQQLPHISPKG